MAIRNLNNVKAIQSYAKSQAEALSEVADWLKQNPDAVQLAISIDESEDWETPFYATLFYEIF
jgi:hypothetical protein